MGQNDISVQVVLDDGSVKKTFKLLEDEAAKSGKKATDNLSSSGLKDIFSAEKLGLSGAGGFATGLNQTLELLSKVKNAIAATVNFFLDFTREAERLKQVNAQFDLLSSRAIGAGNDLREALEKSAKGLTTNEDLLGAANKAIIELGSNVKDLPAVFDLARKSTFVFGGTAADNFEQITRAIVSGSARQLRSLGLFVDLNKAVKDYADRLHVLPEKLTEAEIQQARLNAVLAKGETAFAGVTNVKEVSTAFTKLGVDFKEAGASISSVVNTIFGPALKSLAETGSEFLKKFSTELDASFGADENTRRIAQIKILSEQIEHLKEIIAKPNVNLSFDVEDYKKELRIAQAQLDSLKDSQQALIDDQRKSEARRGVIPQAVQTKLNELNLQDNPLSRFTPDEIKKNRATLNEAIAKGEDEGLQIRIKAAEQIQNLQDKNRALGELDAERQVQVEVDLEARIAKIKEDFSVKKGFDATLANELIAIETENANAKIEEIEKESGKRRLQFATQLSATLKGVLVSGISSTFQQIGKNLQAGKALFDDFGAGIIGIIGDMVIKLGEGLVAQGIGLEAFIDALTTLLPGSGFAAAAAGVALITFGAALKASVGGGGGSSTSADVSGGGGLATEPGGTTTVNPSATAQAPGTSVTVNVMGNILDRRQTGLELTEVLQDAFSQQGVQIKGGNFA